MLSAHPCRSKGSPERWLAGMQGLGVQEWVPKPGLVLARVQGRRVLAWVPEQASQGPLLARVQGRPVLA